MNNKIRFTAVFFTLLTILAAFLAVPPGGIFIGIRMRTALFILPMCLTIPDTGFF